MKCRDFLQSRIYLVTFFPPYIIEPIAYGIHYIYIYTFTTDCCRLQGIPMDYWARKCTRERTKKNIIIIIVVIAGRTRTHKRRRGCDQFKKGTTARRTVNVNIPCREMRARVVNLSLNFGICTTSTYYTRPAVGIRLLLLLQKEEIELYCKNIRRENVSENTTLPL